MYSTSKTGKFELLRYVKNFANFLLTFFNIWSIVDEVNSFYIQESWSNLVSITKQRKGGNKHD